MRCVHDQQPKAQDVQENVVNPKLLAPKLCDAINWRSAARRSDVRCMTEDRVDHTKIMCCKWAARSLFGETTYPLASSMALEVVPSAEATTVRPIQNLRNGPGHEAICY